jgi:succinoglycan biosynthesis transport protein ExoP
MDAGELLAHLAKRSRLIGACVTAALLLAILYIFLTPAEYLATASLLFDPNANGSLTADTALGRAQPDPNAGENQVRLVFSDNVLRRVVDHENLTTDIEFGMRPKGLITRLLEALGLRRTSTEDAITGAITALRDHIYTRRSERSLVIDVGVYAREAAKSARLTDALAQAFIQEGTATRVDFAKQQSDEIRTRLSDLKARIEAAEGRVQRYKAEHSIFDNDGKVLTNQQLADAEHDLAQAHLRVVEAKARLDQLRASLAAGRDPASLPDALRSPAIERIKTQIADIIRQQANLRTTLGPRHPAFLETENQLRQARELMQVELRRLSEGARNDYDIAIANEAGLQKRVAELRTKASETNEALVKMRELQRDVEVSQAIYDRFLKASGFVASDQLATPTARIISAANIPTRPESPRKLLVLSVALAIGLGLGFFLALIGAARARRPAAPSPRGLAPGSGTAATTPGRQTAEPAPRTAGRPARAASENAPETAEAGATQGRTADARPVKGRLGEARLVQARPVEETPVQERTTEESLPASATPSAKTGEVAESATPAPIGETLSVTPSAAQAPRDTPPTVAEREPRAQSQPAPTPPPRSAAPARQSSVFAEAELPEHFEIPMLAGPEERALSLSARLRAARDNPAALLPHRREVELHPGSKYSRVMRDLRRVLGLRCEARPLIVTIVSESRDCGKSTLAINLARAFADAGSRVLVLDADRRNAALTQAVGTDAPEGRVRLGEAIRPVFALDGSWRSGVFLSSLALGRSDQVGPGRRATASMPSFSSLRSLADVLIIDTQTGTRGPALGPDLPIGATLLLAPAESADQSNGEAPFSHVELAMGQGNFSGGTASRRPARAGV